MDSYEKLMDPSKIVVASAVESFEILQNEVTVSGYAFIQGQLLANPELIRQTLVLDLAKPPVDEDGNIREDEVTRYRIPTRPAVETKIPAAFAFEKVEGEAAQQLSDQYHYTVSFDLGTLAKGKPIATGQYQLFLLLEQFSDGVWRGVKVPLDVHPILAEELVYTSKMHDYMPKNVGTYALALNQRSYEATVQIKVTKLSVVNPANLIVSDQKKQTERRKVRRAKKLIFKIAYSIFKKILPIRKNHVAFASDSRVTLSGNLEYVYQEMMAREKPFDVSFYFKQTNSEPKTITEYIRLARAFATSRYILLDDFYPLIYSLKIRQGVDLVQVWHAAGAFKTFGFSRVGMKGGPKLSSKNHRNYTRASVSSSHVVNDYAEGFGIDRKRVVPLGVPRTDMFFDEAKKARIVAELEQEMPFLKDKKVIMFAPTFRGPGQNTAYYPFDWLNYKALYDAFYEQGFVFLLKIHPFVKNSPDIPYEYQDFFYDVSNYREINDLLLISDVLITDYSSVVFEYSLLGRQTIFFAPDLTEYMSSRSFYVNYRDFIPGPFAANNHELIAALHQYNQVDEARLTAFLDYYFDDRDGEASKRVVDALENNFEDYPLT